MTIPGAICLDEAAGVQWDVIVIGAGPAGAVATRLLAQRGVKVLLVERQAWPRRKACGGCLNGRAIALLQATELNHVLAASKSVPVTQWILQSGGKRAELDLPSGVAIDRMAFDAALVGEAITAGAAFLPGTTATVESAFSPDAVRSVKLSAHSGADCTVDARIVLVADGLGHPSLKQISGFDSQIQPTARVGLSLTISDMPALYRFGAIFMAISRLGYVGLVRTADGCGNLAAAIDPVQLRSQGGAANVVRLILQQAGLPEPAFSDLDQWRGTPLLTRRSNRLSARRILLLGDAAGYSEPFTGEGIGWALASAVFAIPYVLRNLDRWDSQSIRQWELNQRRQNIYGQAASRMLAGLLRSPMAVRWAMRALGAAPFLARPLVRRIHQQLQR